MENSAKIPTTTVQRILLEHDLTDSRKMTCIAKDGTSVEFAIRTVSNDERQRLRAKYDAEFPMPPVVQNNLGCPHFDLTDDEFQQKLQTWNEKRAKGVLAASLDCEDGAIDWLVANLPREFINSLFASIELLNGVQSEPLIEIVREALWSQEVMTWVETTPPDDDDPNIPVTDTPLYREMDAMIACGLTLEQWERMSPRHKIMYMTYHSYTQAREAYVHYKIKHKPAQGRHHA